MQMNMKLYNKSIGKRLVISVLLFHLFTFLPLSAQTVKNITVSQEQSYTDHISLEGDVTDKDIMVKFVFDEATNQLTVTLISHRMIFVFREDVRFKPLIKGRKLRPDQLPYVVTYEPKDQYRISKLFKSTVPRPTKKYVFHRWIDYEGLQPVPQEYAMVNDYITQTFDILKKGSSVVVRLRDVMLMNDVSKHINKRRYEIPFGRDLYTEYHVDIQRNPCFGLDEDIASAKAALDGIRKSYNSLRKSYGNGTVDNQESLKLFEDLKNQITAQYPRKDEQSPCPDIQQALDAYNAYTDSISSMNCKVAASSLPKIAGDGISSRMLMTKTRQIDAAVTRYLLSTDPIERRDIIMQTENTIKACNETINSQGVYTAEQRQAVQLFREAERYFRNNCNRQ
jgi:hypothetical protein